MSARLACAVLSLNGQAGLADAVRSLVAQKPEPEVVVVNSGGGDPAGLLTSAGLDVPVVNVPERLFPGGARNLGIGATSARHMAFLAADSEAEPGWVARRLRAHDDGADVVSSVITCPPRAPRTQAAGHLLLHWRRMADTPARERLLYGLSYDRALFDRFGLFREDLRTGEDTEFNRRLAGTATFAWAPGVRNRHRGPVEPVEFLRDQHVRGRRRIFAMRGLGIAPSRPRLLGELVMNAPRALLQARRTRDPVERAELTRGWPLLAPGALAYLCGAVAADLDLWRRA